MQRKQLDTFPLSWNFPENTLKRKRGGGETGRGRELLRDLMAWMTASQNPNAE